MRTLCLLLILANVLFFGWSQLIDTHVSRLDHPPPAGATPPPPRIVMASEQTSTPVPQVVKDVEPPRVEPVPESPPTPVEIARADPLSCNSIGPFAELKEASQAQAALRGAGFEPRQRIEEGEIWVGYWVSVQNVGNRDAAETAARTIRESGITDVYLMPGSEPPNVVSLGLFTDYQRAQRRADDIRALGFEPRIDDRKRTGSVYWIDVDLAEPGQPIDLGIFQPGQGKIMRLELRACPQEKRSG